MENTSFIYHRIADVPPLHRPILIEGLPGVGNVGKLAAEHLIDNIKAVPFAKIYSKHFPPQVLVEEDGVIRLVGNTLYYYRRPGTGDEDAGNTGSEGGVTDGGGERCFYPWSSADLIFLVGDYQGVSPEGQYELTYRVLSVAKEMGVEMIFTLGGYGLGRLIETPRVLGAATCPPLVEEMKKYGVVFEKDEPGSGIVGASGLLLGLGKLFNMEGVCLMGETSGYFIDPKSAKEVLRILSSILGVSVDFSALEDRAQEIDLITSKLKELEESGTEGAKEPSADDVLRYIG